MVREYNNNTSARPPLCGRTPTQIDVPPTTAQRLGGANSSRKQRETRHRRHSTATTTTTTPLPALSRVGAPADEGGHIRGGQGGRWWWWGGGDYEEGDGDGERARAGAQTPKLKTNQRGGGGHVVRSE